MFRKTSSSLPSTYILVYGGWGVVGWHQCELCQAMWKTALCTLEDAMKELSLRKELQAAWNALCSHFFLFNFDIANEIVGYKWSWWIDRAMTKNEDDFVNWPAWTNDPKDARWMTRKDTVCVQSGFCLKEVRTAIYMRLKWAAFLFYLECAWLSLVFREI